ncbi:hypothetical protein JQS43_04640 [Natronosporangium hydrolyticum]|uniref:Uncharacterized protein n=1 Tax=Natronosporangium hydrolyticum TaxID=2811111 RepID=A0A895YNE6_9ACTN|nr:hypothetical protein [Natronosporangium hydrolyticum]QSB15640.1 hypothetical protein JQS43_04640 [Natronosporangium hydrolyticum]
MIRVPDSDNLGRTRDDVTAAVEQLFSAAEHGAKQVGRTSRRSGQVARRRVTDAGRALRGEPPVDRWRWLGTGLALGAVAGAAVATLLARRETREAILPEQVQATAASLRERANGTAETVRERAGAAAEDAANATREAAAKVRDEATKVRDEVNKHRPTKDAKSSGQDT